MATTKREQKEYICWQWHKLERSSLFKDAQPYHYKQKDGMLVLVFLVSYVS
jgi:hypothetical protein